MGLKPSVIYTNSECKICNNKIDNYIDLQCGHNVHTNCLLNWWNKSSHIHGLTCAICYRPVYDCIMVLDADDEFPLAFYRHDERVADCSLIRIHNNNHSHSCNYKIIKIQNGAARDRALNTVIELAKDLNNDVDMYIIKKYTNIKPLHL